MGIRWLENGVFHNEPWGQYPYPYGTRAFYEEEERLRQSEAGGDLGPKPVESSVASGSEAATIEAVAHDPYDLPVPPPNSEVAAQPRADLEHRLRGAFTKGDPLQAIEKSVALHNRMKDLNDYPTDISQLISRDVVTVTSDSSTEEAIEKLRESQFHHLPVVDEEGKLIGLVSDRDLLGREGVLADRMESRVLTATRETQIQEATKVLVEQQFHSLVVVDEERRPAGIITSFDLLQYLVEHPAMRLWQSGSLT